MADSTWFDWLILAVILLSSLLGVWRGVVSEVLALLAWVAAFFAARMWGAAATEQLSPWLHNLHEPALRQMVGFATVFVATLLLFALARFALSSLLRAIGLGLVDRFLGALFGLGRGVLLVLVGILLGGLTDLPRQQWWREALLAPPLETAVLAAKTLLPPLLAQRIHYHSAHAARSES
jgi:membrane protein required for colicin V production